MGKWSWLTALALVLAMVQPVGAFEIPSGDLLAFERPQPPQLLGFRAPDIPMYFLELIRPNDSMEARESELILDENLVLLNTFATARTEVLPFLPAHIYSVEINRLSQLKKSQFMTMEEWQERTADRFRPGANWLMGSTTSERVRATERALYTTEAKAGTPLGFMSWLTEDEGLFSGRPWDWDNFLPRILSAAGLILGLLVAVEFMHILVVVGLRGMGGKQRRSGGH